MILPPCPLHGMKYAGKHSAAGKQCARTPECLNHGAGVFASNDYAPGGAPGPLAELSVRLKLVYALEVISRQEYEDAELLMSLHKELQQDPGDYLFTDDEILGPFSELHIVSPRFRHRRKSGAN